MPKGIYPVVVIILVHTHCSLSDSHGDGPISHSAGWSQDGGEQNADPVLTTNAGGIDTCTEETKSLSGRRDEEVTGTQELFYHGGNNNPRILQLV